MVEKNVENNNEIIDNIEELSDHHLDEVVGGSSRLYIYSCRNCHRGFHLYGKPATACPNCGSTNIFGI